MPRRSHKKSRKGCLECKKRHIKVRKSLAPCHRDTPKLTPQCDESRPECVNCVTAHRSCDFASQVLHPYSRPGLSVFNPVTTPKPSPASAIGHDSPLETSLDLGLKLDHLELLHHFCTVTYTTLTPDPTQRRCWQTTAIGYGLSFPFLMSEILGVAALHLGRCRPARQDYYYTKATELQSNALTGFNAMQRNIDANSCGAVLLFSCLLALHVFADPPRTGASNSQDYFDHVLRCLKLMQSVRALVITDWWSQLSQSDLKPLFQFQSPEQPYDIPEECQQLESLTRNLDERSKSACDEAIERLQWTFVVSDVPSQKHETIRHLLAWPIQTNEVYLDLLNERRPEALVILAHYAVILHNYRGSWAVGDAGMFLVRAIDAYLGQAWGKWMAWPRKLTAWSS